MSGKSNNSLIAIALALVLAVPVSQALADNTRNQQSQKQSTTQTNQASQAQAQAEAKVKSAAAGGGASQRQSAETKGKTAAADNTAKLQEQARQRQARKSGPAQQQAAQQQGAQQKQKQAQLAQKAEWTSEKLKAEHFNEHKSEMGAKSKEEYFAKAKQTIADGKEFNFLWGDRQVPRVGYYNKARNAFVSTSQQKGAVTIHTYFHPNANEDSGRQLLAMIAEKTGE